MYGGDDGARTRDLCRDRAQETGNLKKISAMDGSFWRFEARMATVIVPLLCPRPLPYKTSALTLPTSSVLA
jgi:hypothetical protein